MRDYIATFHTHFAALQTKKNLSAGGAKARLAPVPRSLSASCGTCVKYSAEEPLLDRMDVDTEMVVQVISEGEYQILMDQR